MYISDYYLGVSNTGKCYQASDSCKTKNWMWLWSNDTNSPTKEYEWFIQRKGNNAAWFIQSNDALGASTGLAWTLNIGIRPVMYLSRYIKLNGSGTINSPFIINKVKRVTNGDTSPLTDKNTDITLLYMVQDITNPKNYTIMEEPPVQVSGFILNEEKSNCIPQESDNISYLDYSIVESSGKVVVNVQQSKPNQVVCRIYYDYE